MYKHFTIKRITAAFSLAVALVSFSADAAQGPQPSICTRACWGARAPNCGITQMSGLTRAIIHHTAGTGDYSSNFENSKAVMRNIQNYHMGLSGWCDIAYHFLTDAAGNLFEGRSGAMSGLPRGTHDACNANSFGFTALGYYHPPYNQPFTSASRNALEAVIAWRMPSGWSPYGSGTYCSKSVGFLDGHYRVVSTACPGDGIIPQIAGMRDGVNARKNAPPAAGNSWSVATSRNLDGRMQIFAQSPGGSLRTKWQTSPNGVWSTWLDLGGQILGVPAAVTNLDGRIQVFVRGTDSQVYTIYQTAPNGGFSQWVGLGGSCATDPCVINNADGRIQVFTRATDNTLWSNWQTAPNGLFYGWMGLGGSCFAVPAAGQNSDGRIQVFTRAGDNTLWSIWQTAPNGGFSSWLGLGGSCADAPGVSRNADGRLQVFTRATDNTVWSIWQTAPNGGFSPWLALGGSCYSAPGVGRNADGRIQVFTHAGDNTVWTAFQTAVNGGFTAWSGFGGSCQAAPSVGNNADGRLQIFTRATDNTVWSRYQNAPNGLWDPWIAMGN